MGKCLSPFTKKEDPSIPLPCGKCYECKARKVSGWSFRLMKETERSRNAKFITLTYTNETVPLTKNGYMTLKKEDLQKFFKRLRKRSTEQIKYYAVGEYGGKTKRPHYHIIMFNVNVEDIEAAWKLDSEEIGQIHVGDVNEASIGYTLKYISKDKTEKKHERDDRLKEFSLMSKKLGDNYINEKTKKWHKADVENRYYIPLKDGKRIAVPRYYRNNIYNGYDWLKIKAKMEQREKLSTKGLTYKQISEVMTQENLIRIAKGKKINKPNDRL